MGSFLFSFCTLYPLAFYIAICQHMAMVCLYCHSKTKIINSRHQKQNNQTWRRRRCTACSAIFTTEERPLMAKAFMIESNGILTPFERDKLYLSIHRSLGHRSGAISEASHLVNSIIAKLLPLLVNASLDKQTIKLTASTALKHFDKAAYTHYLAYHPTS